MKFSTKIALFSTASASLFLIAILCSLSALLHVQHEFAHYIHTGQAVERDINELYTQGLQMGQALRNMVLDPKNPKAYENLKAAQVSYDKAFAQVQQNAKGSVLESALQQLPPLRSAHAAAQDKVLALVETNGNAIDVINRDETPAWRQLKAKLIQQRDAATINAQEVHKNSIDASNMLAGFSIGLALFAALVALVMGVVLIRSIASSMNRAISIADAVAKGDLTQAIATNGSDEVSCLMQSLSNMSQSLSKVVSSVRQGSEGVSTASAEIASGNNDLSARTESQASALEQTAASMEQFSTAVKQTAERAGQANQLAMNASSVAAQGGEVVAKVVETMKGINVSSRKIADIISVIDGIAFQTNILALNAAVEAARAGEQGRGFAVVASEVRSLAGRSANAAKEIKSLINASVERVEQGTTLVDLAGTTMAEVVSSIRSVTDLMGEISSASSEQSLSVVKVSEAVTHMDQSTQQNAALVEEMAAAASSLKSQAQELVQTVAVFDLGRHVPATTGNLSNTKTTGVRHPLSKPATTHRPSAPAKLSSQARLPAAPKKPSPATVVDDWETF
ncbi:MAG: HAMP domain-containing protein [Rhodoferax sp.]|nr:HAMP domain-containing protein [Rhodoferax sp.]